jgi:hypothetical protein
MRPDEVSRSVDYRSLSSARGVRRCRALTDSRFPRRGSHGPEPELTAS